MSWLNKEFDKPWMHHIWCDGSFRPPDNASCAYVIFSGKSRHVVKMESLAFRGKTINQMELMAINKALDFPNMPNVVIYTDSSYCLFALTLWRKTWAKNDWMTPLGQPVKNKELIIEIAAKLDAKKYSRFVKCKAHTGDPYNSIADYMATSVSAKMRDDPAIIEERYPI